MEFYTKLIEVSGEEFSEGSLHYVQTDLFKTIDIAYQLAGEEHDLNTPRRFLDLKKRTQSPEMRGPSGKQVAPVYISMQHGLYSKRLLDKCFLAQRSKLILLFYILHLIIILYSCFAIPLQVYILYIYIYM